MSRDALLSTGLAGLVAGIFMRSFVDLGISFSLLLVLLAGVLFFVERRTLLLALFCFAAALGMIRYEFADHSGVEIALDSFLGQSVVLQGIIDEEPDERESVTRFILSVERPKTRMLLTTEREPAFLYGDRISVQGRVMLPKNFQDESTLREVDYRAHLAKDGIYYEMFKPKMTLIAHGEGHWVIEKLFAFKNAFIENINRVIPEPHAALLGGLVVGAKQSLGKKLLDDFRTVGVIHIVVLSGYNITIIAYFIEWLFSRLRKNARLTVAATAMVLFALMVGASATVVRATLMALLVILARSTGRIYAVTRALLIAGVVMLIHNPKILVFDTSFQLSFLATVGLIYLSPLVEPRVHFITEKWKLREVVVATASTQLFVLPFILYKTGLFSLVSLPVNLLILSAIPLTMLFGFCAGISAFIFHLLALPFAYIAYAFLAYELGVVEWFARLPFASIVLASFPLWLVIAWYSAYGVFMWRMRLQSSAQSQTS